MRFTPEWLWLWYFYTPSALFWMEFLTPSVTWPEDKIEKHGKRRDTRGRDPVATRAAPVARGNDRGDRRVARPAGLSAPGLGNQGQKEGNIGKSQLFMGKLGQIPWTYRLFMGKHGKIPWTYRKRNGSSGFGLPNSSFHMGASAMEQRLSRLTSLLITRLKEWLLNSYNVGLTSNDRRYIYIYPGCISM